MFFKVRRAMQDNPFFSKPDISGIKKKLWGKALIFSSGVDKWTFLRKSN